MNTTPKDILEYLGSENWELAEAEIDKSTSEQINAMIFLLDGDKDHTCSYTLIAKAVESRNTSIVQLLIDKGADVNEICRKGVDLNRTFTPLSLAVVQNDEVICKILLDHGAYIGLPANMFDNSDTDCSPLHYVMMTGNCPLLRLFLERGGQSLANETLLKYRRMLGSGVFCSNARKYLLEVVTFYRKYNSDNNTTVVYREMENGRFETAIELIKTLKYEDVNRRMLINDNDFASTSTLSSNKAGMKWTLLTYAVKKGRVDVAEKLIEGGADVKLLGNNLDFLVFSPFTLAVQANNIEMCKLLLNKGANPKYPWCLPDGESVIGRVLESGNAALLKLLFFYGVTECGLEHVLLEKSGLSLSLEVLKILFIEERPSQCFWRTLVTKSNGYQRQDPARTARARDIIEMVFRFIPRVYCEFIDVITDHPCCMSLNCEWLWGRIGTVPSLQHICRHVVRKHCEPCTIETMGHLDLPKVLLAYMMEI